LFQPSQLGSDIAVLGFTSMTILAVAVNLRLVLEIHNGTLLELVAYILMFLALLVSMILFSFTYPLAGPVSCTGLPQLDWCSNYMLMSDLWSQPSYWLTVIISVLIVLTPRFTKKALNSAVEVSPAMQALLAARKHASDLEKENRALSLKRLRASRLHLPSGVKRAFTRQGSVVDDGSGPTSPRSSPRLSARVGSPVGNARTSAVGELSEGSRRPVRPFKKASSGLKESSFNFDVHEKSAKFIFAKSIKSNVRWSLEDYDEMDAQKPVSFSEVRFRESL